MKFIYHRDNKEASDEELKNCFWEHLKKEHCVSLSKVPLEDGTTEYRYRIMAQEFTNVEGVEVYVPTP